VRAVPLTGEVEGRSQQISVRIRFIEDRTAPKQRLGVFQKIAGTASVRNGLADSITIRLKLHGNREEVAANRCAKSVAWRVKTN
jgi:hypothetical protein